MRKFAQLLVVLAVAAVTIGVPSSAHAGAQGGGPGCLNQYNLDTAECDRATWIEKGSCYWQATQDYWGCVVRAGM